MQGLLAQALSPGLGRGMGKTEARMSAVRLLARDLCWYLSKNACSDTGRTAAAHLA